MLTLCIDTAYKALVCVLIEDNKIICRKDFFCFKRQSEQIFPVLEEMRIFSNGKILNIDSICITNGPGSYTGVRIALTIAKVLSAVKKIDIYTISTLCLYAANNSSTMVILDARAERAYVGIYDKGKTILADCVLNLKDIIDNDYNLVGDASLIGKQDYWPDFAEAFLKTRDNWHLETNPNYLVPIYLKENKDYLL